MIILKIKVISVQFEKKEIRIVLFCFSGRKLPESHTQPDELINENTVLKKLLTMSKDCTDRTCFLNFEYEETCFVYSATPDFPNCNYPCSADNCKLEVFFNIDCPIWSCLPKPSPAPPTPSAGVCRSAACISAVSILVVLILICLGLVCLLCKKRNAANSQSANNAEIRPIINFGQRMNSQPYDSFRTRWSNTTAETVAFENIPLNATEEETTV